LVDRLKLLRAARTKTNRSRQVPVHPDLARILKEWREGGFKRMLYPSASN